MTRDTLSFQQVDEDVVRIKLVTAEERYIGDAKHGDILRKLWRVIDLAEETEKRRLPDFIREIAG